MLARVGVDRGLGMVVGGGWLRAGGARVGTGSTTLWMVHPVVAVQRRHERLCGACTAIL